MPDPKIKTFYLLFIFCLTALTGCSPSQSPQITYLSSDVQPLSFQDLSVKSHFMFKNPNPVGLRGSVEYDFTVNRQNLLSGKSSNIEMAASGETPFALDSKVELAKVFGVFSDLLKEIESGKSSMPFEINGKFKSDLLGIPFEVPVAARGDLPLPKLPGVELKSISIGSIGLNSVTLKVKAGIKNSNNFPVSIDSFPYQLISEGKEIASGNIEEPGKIEANGVKEITLNLKINFAQLGETLANQIRSNSFKADFKNTFNLIH